jgi:hypothetical protein
MTDSDRADLPIPDYDHVPLGSLSTRIRSLDESGLEKLMAYEGEHADRLPVRNLLRQRLEALRSGAEPTDGAASGGMPETAAGPAGGSKVAPQTQGPTINPPSHGDPTNPAQPR